MDYQISWLPDLCEACIVVVPILEMKKLRRREGEDLPKSNTTYKW